jgi:hypothetical protein
MMENAFVQITCFKFNNLSISLYFFPSFVQVKIFKKAHQLAFEGKHLESLRACGVMEYSQDGDALLLSSKQHRVELIIAVFAVNSCSGSSTQNLENRAVLFLLDV